MKLTPSSRARRRAARASSSRRPPHMAPPRAHAPYPISETQRSLLPSCRYFMGRHCSGSPAPWQPGANPLVQSAGGTGLGSLPPAAPILPGAGLVHAGEIAAGGSVTAEVHHDGGGFLGRLGDGLSSVGGALKDVAVTTAKGLAGGVYGFAQGVLP